MNELLKTALSLSVSGSALILILLLCKPLYQNRLSRRWQYYVWLIVIARLLLPFGPEQGPAAELFRLGESRQIQQDRQADPPSNEGEIASPPPVQAAGETLSQPVSFRGLLGAAGRYLWLIWLAGALALLVRRITAYQSFARYIRAGRRQVSEIALLDRLAQVQRRAGVKRPVELACHSLISSPILLGLFRPCIVLPEGPLPEQDFEAVVLHELTHYKRLDGVYQWLVQLTLCLHWFNPLVWRMARQIRQDCEFACDEGAVRGMDQDGRRAYGDALVRAAAAGGQLPPPPSSIALSESAELLKERLTIVMNKRKSPKWVQALSLLLAAALTAGSAAAGAYTGPVRQRETSAQAGQTASQTPAPSRRSSSLGDLTEKYYQHGSLPLFQAAFARLTEAEQLEWLETILEDEKTAYFSLALDKAQLSGDQIDGLAEQTYQKENIALFSLLARRMDQAQLESWLDRALEDKKFTFQAVAARQMEQFEEDWDWDWDEEQEKQSQQMEQQQLEEYRRVGVTRQGKNYYYQGQPVRIFLDQRPNYSVYTLEINPQGTVDIKIIRDSQNQIQRAEQMTQEEAAQMMEDWED